MARVQALFIPTLPTDHLHVGLPPTNFRGARSSSFQPINKHGLSTTCRAQDEALGCPTGGLQTSIIQVMDDLPLPFIPRPKSSGFLFISVPSLFSASSPLFGSRDLTYVLL